MAAPIYNLSDFQFDSLVRMANTDRQLLAVLDVAVEDDQDTQDRLKKQQDEAKDLVTLGLIEDKSGSFVEKIMAHKLQAGRGYAVYLITDIGFDMFHGTNKRKAN